ncbi:phosphopantetheine-binding protein [Amycolatopsis sp. NPDC021455]|uniref:phosphopantetheine-binding protein n=1 Tax=Amycolatopsis sp. NPDC021455 TaxID=3154901 RepID=UPI0034040B40
MSNVVDVVLDAVRSVGNLDAGAEVRLDARLFDSEELGIDSIGALEMLTILERELDLDIDDDELSFERLVTVQDVIDLVNELIAAPATAVD